jgi:dTDP-4-dehydrorhamnose reductase
MMFDGPDVREADTPQPTNYYAWTKAWADAQLVPLMGDKVMIARIHTPLSKHANPRNLLTKLQGFDKVVGEPSSLTVVEDFLAALEQLVEKRASGIYNVVNPGSISLYEVVKLMQQNGLVDPAKEVKELSREQLQEMVASSGGAHQTYPILSTEKLSALGISMRPVREAVEASIKEYES